MLTNTALEIRLWLFVLNPAMHRSQRKKNGHALNREQSQNCRCFCSFCRSLCCICCVLYFCKWYFILIYNIFSCQYVTYLCSSSHIFKNQSSSVSIECVMILQPIQSHISLMGLKLICSICNLCLLSVVRTRHISLHTCTRLRRRIFACLTCTCKHTGGLNCLPSPLKLVSYASINPTLHLKTLLQLHMQPHLEYMLWTYAHETAS